MAGCPCNPGVVFQNCNEALSPKCRPWTCCSSVGAEIDLLLKRPGERKPLTIEIKRGLAPKLERGFYLACDTISR